MGKIITVENFEKSYGSVKAVKGISFSVEKGSLFAFLGPNGAGKSTTIDTLCTLLKCQKGTITIAGHTLGKEDEAIRKSIGVVFQQSLLDTHLTVEENLKIRGSMYKFSKAELLDRIRTASRIAGTTDFMKQRYGQLSGGQKRRADIARALLVRPQVLFLDEPMTGLDPATRESIWTMFESMRKEWGMTIFLTTHYMEEAVNADDIVIIRKGEIVEEGTPAVLKQKYTKDHLFAYGAKEDLSGILSKNGYEFEQVSDAWKIRVEGMQMVLDLIGLIKDRIGFFEVKMGTMDEMFLNIIGETSSAEDAKGGDGQ
jgi:multidrug/hemolysin transport system ATP-binding protein